MNEITVTTIRRLSEDFVTDTMRETVPNWLLALGDQITSRIWELPWKELSSAAYDILENEFGKGQSAERVHLAFWKEYDEAAIAKQPFRLANVVSGITSIKRFRDVCGENMELVVWLLTPPFTHANRLLELSIIGEERMREILQASPIAPNGKVDAKLALAQIKLWELLQDRVHGAVAQTINQKSLNVNMSASAPMSKEALTSVKDIEARLKELKEKAIRLTSPAPIRVDATPLIQPNMVKDDE